MSHLIRTGNSALAKTQIRLGGYASGPVTIQFDPTMDDVEWSVYDGEDPVKGPFRITASVSSDIRARLQELGGEPAPSKAVEVRPEPVPTRRAPEPSSPALDTLTAEILILNSYAREGIVQIGLRLIQAKAMIPHGGWLAYVQERLEFTPRWAQICMKAGQLFGANAKLTSHLEPGTFYQLMDAHEEDRPALIAQAANMTNEEALKAADEAKQARKDADEERKRRESAEAAVLVANQRVAESEARAKAAETREPVIIETPVFEAPPEMKRELEELRQVVADKDRTIQQREADIAKVKKWLEDVNKDLKELRERVDHNYELDQSIAAKEQRAKELTDLVTHLESSFADSKQNTRNGAELMRVVYPLERMAWGIAKEVSDLRKEGVGGRCEDADLTKLSRKLRDIAADLDAIVKARKDADINVEVPKHV